MVRTFSAIDIEDEEILKELSYIRDTIDLGFNTVPEEKMHLTLEFFEDLSNQEIEKYKNKLSKTEIGSFTINLIGVSAFPSQDHIRVVWAGLKEEKEVRDLYKIISRHNIPSDNNYNFKPHITLFRVNKVSGDRKKRLQNNIREFENYHFGEMEVNKIKLFKSHLTPQGSKYTVLDEFEL